MDYNQNEPLLNDLNCLAHELEHDCNYPFSSLRDSRGEAYTTKLERLREQIGNIDAMLSDSQEMVGLLRESYKAIHAILQVIPQKNGENPFKSLAAKLADSPAVAPILDCTESALEECDCCGESIGLSTAEVTGTQILCAKCKKA